MFSSVLKEYDQKFKREHKDWWKEFIISINNQVEEACESCSEITSRILDLNAEIAKINRGGDKSAKIQNREKRKLQKKLAAHKADTPHEEFDILILTPALEAKYGDRMDSPLRIAADPPAPLPEDEERWPLFAGRPAPPMVNAELPKRLREAQAGVEVDDFVLILVEPDDKWALCIQVGQCVEVDEAAEKLRVHLYGNENNKIRGVMYAGWAKPARGWISFSKKRGRGYTHKLIDEFGPDTIIDWGFQLTSKNLWGRIKVEVLKVAARNERVDFQYG